MIHVSVEINGISIIIVTFRVDISSPRFSSCDILRIKFIKDENLKSCEIIKMSTKMKPSNQLHWQQFALK